MQPRGLRWKKKNRIGLHFTGIVSIIILSSLTSVSVVSSISSDTVTANPIVSWNQFTTELGLRHRVTPPFLARDYALVHVAIHDALLLSASQHHTDPAQTAIVTGAASEVLAYLFPTDSDSIREKESLQTRQIHGHTKGEITSSLSVGHAVGRRITDYSRTDGGDAVFGGTIPIGPCNWSSASPVGPMVGFQKTYILTSGREFQPQPPYPCESPEDLADMQAVVDARDHLTPEKVAIVHKWGDMPPPTIWNSMLNERIVSQSLGIFDAARASTYLNIAMYDAFVSTWYTKYNYWTARPYQRIPNFTTVIPTPNFPSYTSGHSTVSAAASMVMGDLFPNERGFFAGEAEEAAVSRLLGGIHFPQDNNQGLIVGRQIGEKIVTDMHHDPHPFVHPLGLDKMTARGPIRAR